MMPLSLLTTTGTSCDALLPLPNVPSAPSPPTRDAPERRPPTLSDRLRDERPKDPAHRLVGSRGCGRHDWSCSERDHELRPMTRYLLHVYRGAEGSAYYPDKTLCSLSRGRLARRGQKLEREG